MAKTAEEILIENAYVSEADMVHEESKHVFKAMQEFAAQEVEAYKDRLKSKLKDLPGGLVNRDTFRKLIDTVK
jgi:hypothetical protein